LGIGLETYEVVQCSHGVVVFADLGRSREENTTDRDRAFHGQFNPLTSNLSVSIRVIWDSSACRGGGLQDAASYRLPRIFPRPSTPQQP
jgi:hypothetical protein